MLANSVTKPAGTTMLSRDWPIRYDIGRWRMAVGGPCFRKDRSGESTAFGDGGGASGRTTSSPVRRVATGGATSARATVVVSLRAGATVSGRVAAAVAGRSETPGAGRPGTTAAVPARGA